MRRWFAIAAALLPSLAAAQGPCPTPPDSAASVWLRDISGTEHVVPHTWQALGLDSGEARARVELEAVRDTAFCRSVVTRLYPDADGREDIFYRVFGWRNPASGETLVWVVPSLSRPLVEEYPDGTVALRLWHPVRYLAHLRPDETFGEVIGLR